MRLPHNALRQWWHQPVVDRLDAIERNTRRDTVRIEPPPPHVAAEVSRVLREIRPRDGRKTWA